MFYLTYAPRGRCLINSSIIIGFLMEVIRLGNQTFFMKHL